MLDQKSRIIPQRRLAHYTVLGPVDGTGGALLQVKYSTGVTTRHPHSTLMYVNAWHGHMAWA